MTLNDYCDKVMIPAVLRMLGLPDTPTSRAALEKYTIAELADKKTPHVTTTAELVEKLRALDPIGAMPVFVRQYEQPGADGSFLYDVPAPVRGFARHFIDTPEPCLPDAEGAFPCIWLEA